MIEKGIVKAGLIIITLLFCAQFSSQNVSTVGREKPTTNVFGMITDSENQSYAVQNITIAGRFNDIAVYKKPSDPNTNPDIDKTLVDLCTIREIRVPAPKIVEFNKRKYIEIILISNNNNPTQNEYIIEYSKKLFCDYNLLEKELNFTAIKRLQIQGCKKQEETPRNCPQPAMQNPVQTPQMYKEKQQAIDSTLTKTQALINDLEKKAENLNVNDQDKSIKAQIIQTIADLKQSVQETFKNWFA